MKNTAPRVIAKDGKTVGPMLRRHRMQSDYFLFGKVAGSPPVNNGLTLTLGGSLAAAAVRRLRMGMVMLLVVLA